MQKIICLLLLAILLLPLALPTQAAEEKLTYERIGTSDSGFSTSGTWSKSTIADSTGKTVNGTSLYTSQVGAYAQYMPQNLSPGWYDISFWNIAFQDHQNPMKLTGTVYSNKKTVTDIRLEPNTVSPDRGGIWTKVGTYYFSGSNDEYFRLVMTVSGHNGKAADVKFEKNDTYTPPKVTYQRISTTDPGFSKLGSWKPATMADSTGSTVSGVSLYCGTVGSYAQYTPSDLAPGWYDISFWNIAYQDHQNPMKMNGTVFAGNKTATEIELAPNTVSPDRGGIWTKVGTYYFSGTNDEYFRLVVTGGAMARAADVKFEKNDTYTPPGALTDNKTTVSGSGSWQATGADGFYTVTVHKNAPAADGKIDLYVNGKLTDSLYTDYLETGDRLLGTYKFAFNDEIELTYIPLGDASVSPIDAVSFEPVGKRFATYRLTNLQKEEDTFFISAGEHKVTATVTNNAAAANFKLLCALYENETMVGLVMSEKETVASGETKELCATIPITDSTKNTTLRAYIWDGTETMIPRLPVKTYQAQDTRQPDSFTIVTESFSDLGSWTKSANVNAFENLQLYGVTSGPNTSIPAKLSFSAQKGTYRVWVHSLNFTDRPAARCFNIGINGSTLAKTFGQVGTDGFSWEDGGTVELNGETKLELQDTSGFFAKLDAIVLTKDLSFTPPASYAQLLKKAPLLKDYTTKLEKENMMTDFSLDKNYPGGNYLLKNKENNTVSISTDRSDTSRDSWFYWNFKATSETERTVTFKLSGCDQVLSASGAAYSLDNGKNWDYLTESAYKREFTYSFKAGQTVWFAVTVPYQLSNLKTYLNTLSAYDRAEVSVLCTSEGGREVPLIRVGSKTAPKAVVFTSRHHCCEATPSYMLEGLVDYLCSKTGMPDSIFDTYCFYIIPMVDIDGVENGDQGKDRIPHDHNRDYDEGLYAPIRAIKALAETLDIPFFMDLHCPMLQTDKPYLYYHEDDAETISAFSDLLVRQTANSESENPILFLGTTNFKDSNYTSCAKGYFYNIAGAPFSTTLEFPYTGRTNDVYTIQRMYNFGTDLGKTVETYLSNLK